MLLLMTLVISFLDLLTWVSFCVFNLSELALTGAKDLIRFTSFPKLPLVDVLLFLMVTVIVSLLSFWFVLHLLVVVNY
jgi:hypothetical protein